MTGPNFLNIFPLTQIFSSKKNNKKHGTLLYFIKKIFTSLDLDHHLNNKNKNCFWCNGHLKTVGHISKKKKKLLPIT